MIISDDQLASWKSPAFRNEDQLATDTQAAIRSAINNHPQLAALQPRVQPKGSIKNNTNVRKNSDIDVAIILTSLIACEFTGGANLSSGGLVPYSGISAIDFKNLVGQALNKEFGPDNVDRSGNRVFRIRGSKKVMDADVVPSTGYMFIGPSIQREGIALILDNPDGKIHFNYPEQHHVNGVSKNTATGRRYKRAVRIMKQIDHKMFEMGYATKTASHLIECLVDQVPDTLFNNDLNWRTLIMAICEYLYPYLSAATEPSDFTRWKEVNGHKYLFGDHQRWTRSDAKTYIEKVYLVTSQ